MGVFFYYYVNNDIIYGCAFNVGLKDDNIGVIDVKKGQNNGITNALNTDDIILWVVNTKVFTM